VTDAIDERLADWEARLERLEAAPEAEAVPAAAGQHLLFVPSPSGYELVERIGVAPAPGDVVELEEQESRYAVSRVARSPLPGDARRCVYLEAT
jgi:hypothetical protein